MRKGLSLALVTLCFAAALLPGCGEKKEEATPAEDAKATKESRGEENPSTFTAKHIETLALADGGALVTTGLFGEREMYYFKSGKLYPISVVDGVPKKVTKATKTSWLWAENQNLRGANQDLQSQVSDLEDQLAAEPQEDEREPF